MSLPATDNFNRANGLVGSNWTVEYGDLTIASNLLTWNSFNNSNYSFWNADVFPDDQYAQILKISSGSGQLVGPFVRGSGQQLYLLSGGNSAPQNGKLYKITAGETYTELQDLGSVATPGVTTLKLTVSGTTLKCYYNGVQQGIDQTDASIATGSAGCGVYAAGLLDDWEGGSAASVVRSFLLVRN